MKRVGKGLLWIFGVLISIFLLFVLSVWVAGGNTPEGSTVIAQKQWFNIGGIRQGCFIRGEKSDNPVILFLHGGPGSPELPLIGSTALEQYFTVCYWDQRGAGMSFHSNLDLTTLTLERMIEDTREMTDSLCKQYNVDKIYLMGHSWGSFLGIKTIEKHPERYHAYIGIGQVSNQRESERLAYDYLINRALMTGDDELLNCLEKYDNSSPNFPSNEYLMGVRSSAMNKHGVGMMHENASMVDMAIKILYYGGYTLMDKIHYLQGMQASMNKLFSHVLSENLMETSSRFEIPVYFIQGKYDYQVSHKLAKDYYNIIKAPKKGFFTFEQSAHSPNIEEPERFAKLIDSIR